MAQLVNLTTEYIQNIKYIFTDGKVINLRLIFDVNLTQWFIDVNYNNSFIINGQRVCYSFNLLEPFTNIIPFGIMIIGSNGIDPFRIDSFANGEANIFIETVSDIMEITRDVLSN